MDLIKTDLPTLVKYSRSFDKIIDFIKSTHVRKPEKKNIISKFMKHTTMDKLTNDIFPDRKTYSQTVFLDLYNFTDLILADSSIKIKWSFGFDKRDISTVKPIKNVIGLKIHPFSNLNPVYSDLINAILVDEFKAQSYGDYHFRFITTNTNAETYTIGENGYIVTPYNNGIIKFNKPFIFRDTITLNINNRNAIPIYENLPGLGPFQSILSISATNPTIVTVNTGGVRLGTDEVVVSFRNFTTTEPVADADKINQMLFKYGVTMTYISSGKYSIDIDLSSLSGTIDITYLIMIVLSETFVIPLDIICIED